jgi:hypothetical protein
MSLALTPLHGVHQTACCSSYYAIKNIIQLYAKPSGYPSTGCKSAIAGETLCFANLMVNGLELTLRNQ